MDRNVKKGIDSGFDVDFEMTGGGDVNKAVEWDFFRDWVRNRVVGGRVVAERGEIVLYGHENGRNRVLEGKGGFESESGSESGQKSKLDSYILKHKKWLILTKN